MTSMRLSNERNERKTKQIIILQILQIITKLSIYVIRTMLC